MSSPRNIPRTCEICGKDFLARKHQIKKGHAKYCSIHCRSEANRRPIEERFWEKVDRSNESGCWVWTGAKRSRLGYGGFWNGERWTHAHRVSYELFNGELETGQEVIHICDNPVCVNPAHLIAGSHADNMADAKAKGRVIGGFYNIREENRPLGEKHGQSKLTDNDIREIRRKYEIEGIKVTELARQYGMTHAQIGMIARRKAWIHID